MTLPLTDSELRTTRELAQMKQHVIVGRLSTGEAIYFGTKFSVEKDHLYLVEPSPDELAEIHRMIKQKPDDLAPAKGIVAGMLIGGALWLVIGTIIYFTCF